MESDVLTFLTVYVNYFFTNFNLEIFSLKFIQIYGSLIYFQYCYNLTKTKINRNKFTGDIKLASVAQWLEHLSRKQGVMSSILIWGFVFLFFFILFFVQ
jgi:hypothetical protein